MKKVTAWISSDNKLFKSEAECVEHERWIKLGNVFPSIYGHHEGCRIDFSDFCEWAEENADWLKAFVDTAK